MNRIKPEEAPTALEFHRPYLLKISLIQAAHTQLESKRERESFKTHKIYHI